MRGEWILTRRWLDHVIMSPGLTVTRKRLLSNQRRHLSNKSSSLILCLPLLHKSLFPCAASASSLSYPLKPFSVNPFHVLQRDFSRVVA